MSSTNTRDLEKNVAPPNSQARELAHQITPFVESAFPTKIGDPGPLGLFSFGSTTLILSLYNLQTRSIAHPNVVVGMAVSCGGLAQLLAGMWEFPRGNAFGATAFTSYGAFWLSYAAILIPGTGIFSAYSDESEFRSAVAIYLVTWGLVTFFFFIAALRKNWGFTVLLLLLTVTFWVLAGGEFNASARVIKAGGVLGCITALVAFYCGLSLLLSSDSQPIVRLPLGALDK